MSYQTKIDATKAAIDWLKFQPIAVTEWENYDADFKREYQQIIDDLRVTLRNYKYAQHKAREFIKR